MLDTRDRAAMLAVICLSATGLLSLEAAPEDRSPLVDRSAQLRKAWKRIEEMHAADPHCVAYYTFEKATFYRADDAIKVKNLGKAGAALDAVVHGPAGFSPEGGLPAQTGGMGWDGKTCLTVKDDPRLRPQGEGAIEFWMGPTKGVKGGGYAGVVENIKKLGDDHYGYGVTFCRYQNKPFWYAGAGKGSGQLLWRRFGTSNSDTEWNHWVITWRNRGSRLDCYKNGHSVGTSGDKSLKRFAPVEYTADDMPLTIGGSKTAARPDAQHPSEPGHLGSLAIYDASRCSVPTSLWLDQP